jgi:hypothetical protein
MKRLALAAAAVAFLYSPTFATGIDSRAYYCADLRALIAANGFVFISSPALGDFVVANAYYCSGGERIASRSVATRDTPECVVNYCESRSSGGD